jgi:hypothetical protein
VIKTANMAPNTTICAITKKDIPMTVKRLPILVRNWDIYALPPHNLCAYCKAPVVGARLPRELQKNNLLALEILGAGGVRENDTVT